MCGLENYDDIDTSDGDFFIIKLKGNLGYGIYLVDYEFIGILYANKPKLSKKSNRLLVEWNFSSEEIKIKLIPETNKYTLSPIFAPKAATKPAITPINKPSPFTGG